MSRGKSVVMLIGAVLALQGTLLGACVLYRVVFPPGHHILTTDSPTGKYTVTVTGEPERPAAPAIIHSVWFTVLKDKKPFLATRQLLWGDWLDPSFAILYPQYAWSGESILHFYREEHFQGRTTSEVVVADNSGEVIRYLKVTSDDDTYLLFDIQPGSATSLSIAPPRGDLTYISVEGEFSENKKIEKKRQTFQLMKTTDERITYNLNIINSGPLIDSPNVKKYDIH